MMRHLHLLYFFITLAIGSVSLSIAAFIYAKTKYKLARNYLFFYSIFTGLVVSEALRLYLQMNIPQIQVNTLLFFLAPLGFVMMFVASWFMHETFAVPHARVRNMIVGGITLFIILQHILLGFLELSASRQDSHIPLDWWIYVVYIFSASGVVYIFGLALMYDTKSEKPFRKKLMKKSSILYVLALSAVFVDIFLRESFPLRLFPLFYCVTSISFTHQFLTYYSVHRVPNSDYIFPDETSDQGTEESLFDKYDISPREQEIIRLILQGHTYQKVGETLYISTNTVKTHISNIYAKCGIKSRYELMVLFKPSQSDANFT
jgi:DNA-binding CsgD family transcriptional regulator